MKLPQITECLHCFESTAMLANIRRHSIMVTRVALTLHNALKRCLPASSATMLPGRRLVAVGALMHDIAKTACLHNEKSHAVEGRKYCCEHGWPELGEIVEEHVLLKKFDPELWRAGRFEAKELVFYADKRVRHDEIVNLPERLHYIIDRYSRGEAPRIERINANFAIAFELEKQLFSHLDFAPDELISHLVPVTELGLPPQPESTKEN